MKKEKSDRFGSSVEKFLDYPIPLWFGLLVVLVCMCAGVLFGAAVRHINLGGTNVGAIGPLLDRIASLPGQAIKVLIPNYGKSELLAKEQRFEGQGQFQFNYARGARPDLGYILLNRYDGDLKFSVSELWDLNAQQLVHSWNVTSVDELWAKLKLESNLVDVSTDFPSHRFQNMHAFLEEDGQLLTQSTPSPVVRINRCSKLSTFTSAGIFHHSLEKDYAGNFWTPTHIEPKTVSIGLSSFFRDDGISLLDPNGHVLFEKSVIQILDDNGLGHLIYGVGISNFDPIHLNDIEPVLTDGKFWQKGDVFLSLRNRSAVLLYRPSENKVLWFKSGPWMHQHDVAILNDHQISIFNNRAALNGPMSYKVRGSNELLIYDFNKDEVSSPFKEAFSKLDIRTIFEGRGLIFGNEAWVEESNYGRMLQFDRAGEVTWQYVNRASDGKVFRLNWSRPISRELGDKVRSVVTKEKC